MHIKRSINFIIFFRLERVIRNVGETRRYHFRMQFKCILYTARFTTGNEIEFSYFKFLYKLFIQ